MKTKIYSFFAVLFLCIVLNVNSVNAGSGCDIANKVCWAYGYPSIGASATWIITAPVFTYDLLASGTDARAWFRYHGTGVGASSYASMPYDRKTGSITMCPYDKTVYVSVDESNYSTAWAQFSW